MTNPPDPTAQLKVACPNCGSPRDATMVFCEVCGLDFQTGQMPAPPVPSTAPAREATDEWVVIVDIDRDFFAGNQSDDPSLTAPADAPAREIPLRATELLIGRTSVSGNVHPDIDLGSDPGVSRRHAVLARRPDGTWCIADQGSTNGTMVTDAVLAAGEERVLHEGDVIHVGAWTRITVQRVGA